MMKIEKEHFLKQLGSQIAKVRARKGLSSADLARRTFSDTSLISRIEKGKTNPTAMTLLMICQALDITFSELFDDFSAH